jgi:hypothetical protein
VLAVRGAHPIEGVHVCTHLYSLEEDARRHSRLQCELSSGFHLFCHFVLLFYFLKIIFYN